MIDDPGMNDPSTAGTISGRAVVIGMFAFSVLVVGAMFLYWELYTRPFRPLQNAIVAAFPGSSPRVIGGRHKRHKAGSPETLRIVIQVDFDPTANQAKSEGYSGRLARLAAGHHDLSHYDVLEVHLIRRVPEQATQQWSVSRPVEEWGLSAETVGETEGPAQKATKGAND